jgi:uncharacterized protein (DUF4415 family)
MNASAMKKSSKTDWARIDALTDDRIDTSDIPPLGESFFSRVSVRRPRKSVAVTLQVDADVLAWFQAQGEDYESRLNAALRIYAEAHQAYAH